MVAESQDCDVLKLIQPYDELDSLSLNTRITVLPLRELVVITHGNEHRDMEVLAFLTRANRFEVWFPSEETAMACLATIREHIQREAKPGDGCKGYIDGMIDGMETAVTVPVWAVTRLGELVQETGSFVEFKLYVNMLEHEDNVIFAVSYAGPFPLCDTREEAYRKCEDMQRTIRAELGQRIPA